MPRAQTTRRRKTWQQVPQQPKSKRKYVKSPVSPEGKRKRTLALDEAPTRLSANGRAGRAEAAAERRATPAPPSVRVGFISPEDLAADRAADEARARALGTSTPDMRSSDPAQRLNKEVREQMAVDLRVAGYNYRDIAEKLHVSVKQAFADTRAGLRYVSQHQRRLAEDHRELMVRRCELIYTRLAAGVNAGDTFSVAAFVRTMEFQSKLLGLELKAEEAEGAQRPLQNLSPQDLYALVERLRDSQPAPAPPLQLPGYQGPQPVIDTESLSPEADFDSE